MIRRQQLWSWNMTTAWTSDLAHRHRDWHLRLSRQAWQRHCRSRRHHFHGTRRRRRARSQRRHRCRRCADYAASVPSSRSACSASERSAIARHALSRSASDATMTASRQTSARKWRRSSARMRTVVALQVSTSRRSHRPRTPRFAGPRRHCSPSPARSLASTLRPARGSLEWDTCIVFPPAFQSLHRLRLEDSP